MVKDIVQELNLEHQNSEPEKTPSPAGKEDQKTEGSEAHQSEDPEFEHTTTTDGIRAAEQDIPQDKNTTDALTNPPAPKISDTNIENKAAGKGEDNDNPHVDGEHSTTNTHQGPPRVERDDHVMDTDEFLNSSSGHERTARTEDSNADEGNSISKPPPDFYLPPEVL
jgi:hypothetical protein